MTKDSYPRESLEFRILHWLRESVRLDGGTGRRLPKIEDALGIQDGSPQEKDFAAAIRRLEADGKIRLQEEKWIGFVYAIPL